MTEPAAGSPWPDLDATRIDYSRGSLAGLGLLLLVCVGGPAVAWLSDPPSLDDVGAGEAAAVLGFLALCGYLLFNVVRANRQLRRMPVIELDSQGLWLCDRDGDCALLPWEVVAAVGLSYRLRVARSIREGFTEGSPIRYAWALETYLSAEDGRSQDFLGAPACLRLELPPPPAPRRLPPVRHLVLVPGDDEGPEGIEAAVRDWCPDLWIGCHERPRTEIDRRPEAKLLA